MRKISLQKPSPAMTVAPCALVVAMMGGGNAIAGQTASIAAYRRFISGQLTPDHVFNGNFTDSGYWSLLGDDTAGWVEADLAAESGVTISGSAIWKNGSPVNDCIISGRVSYK